MSERVLVTGGAGFIGSHLSEALIENGFHVTAVDNFDPYYDPTIKEKNVEICRDLASGSNGSYELRKGDILDQDVQKGLRGKNFDYIFHEAAQAGVRTSVKNPMKPNEVNVTGTLEILQLARDLDVKRFVNASSSSVYGKAEYLPFDEEHPTNPVSPYGVSKLAAENYCRVFHEVYGLSTVSLRYFTVYGPRMRPGMAISNFVTRCLHEEPPEIYGNGSKSRDFTYINDIVDANLSLIETNDADGEVLNIGSGGTITIENLANLIVKKTGASVEPIYTDPVEGDTEATHCNYDKAKNLINYGPNISIEEGIENYIKWVKENPDWYKQR